MGKKADAKLVDSVMESIGVLWNLGSQVQGTPLPRGFGTETTLEGVLFLLTCEQGRGETPLVLAAMDDTNIWIISDPLVSGAERVTMCGEVHKSVLHDAISIGTGMVLQALKGQATSPELAAWADYLESEFLGNFLEFVRDMTQSLDKTLSNHAEAAFRTILEAYEKFPRPDSAIGAVLAVMRDNGMTY